MSKLVSLNLSGNSTFTADAARTLFSSEHLRSVAHLNLSGTRTGTAGAVALAGAEGWDRLRSLDLAGTGLEKEGLRALLASQAARNLVWLTLDEGGHRGAPSHGLSPDLAEAMTRLPNLASVHLGLGRCDPRTRQVLSRSDSLAWVSISCRDEDDIQTYRANRAPERSPPLDAALEHRAGWI